MPDLIDDRVVHLFRCWLRDEAGDDAAGDAERDEHHHRSNCDGDHGAVGSRPALACQQQAEDQQDEERQWQDPRHQVNERDRVLYGRDASALSDGVHGVALDCQWRRNVLGHRPEFGIHGRPGFLHQGLGVEHDRVTLEGERPGLIPQQCHHTLARPLRNVGDKVACGTGAERVLHDVAHLGTKRRGKHAGEECLAIGAQRQLLHDLAGGLLGTLLGDHVILNVIDDGVLHADLALHIQGCTHEAIGVVCRCTHPHE